MGQRRRRDLRLILSQAESETLRKLVPAADIVPPPSAARRLPLLALALAVAGIVIVLALAVLMWASVSGDLPGSLSYIRDITLAAQETLEALGASALAWLESL